MKRKKLLLYTLLVGSGATDTAHLQTADQSATGMDVHQLLPQYA